MMATDDDEWSRMGDAVSERLGPTARGSGFVMPVADNADRASVSQTFSPGSGPAHHR